MYIQGNNQPEQRTEQMEIKFTTEQMEAVAAVANHAEGFTNLSPENLKTYIREIDRLWQSMQVASRRAGK
jgi:hypothetical protein